MKLGLEVLLADKKMIKKMRTQKVGLVCHPASVDQKLKHAFDLLHGAIGLSCAFGPQHGVKGELQDNMMESEDEIHTNAKIPVFSLYGKVRRPTPEMMQHFDVLLFDLQDLGCRIYTFITTLLFVMEECAKHNKKLIILDRPNPAGREVEGFILESGWESFVGAAPIPMRHGLTVGELAQYYKKHFSLDLDLKVIKMQGYFPKRKPGFGWPEGQVWINPSPNAQTLNMARAYPGTVLIEGTNLSEGRGTTRALEQIGAAGIDFAKVLSLMHKKDLKGKSSWLAGTWLRECFFQPTFHKFSGEICSGLHLHYDFTGYSPMAAKPYRVVTLMLKCVHELYPKFTLFRDFAYEYVFDKLAFDVINGGPKLRQWIEDKKSTTADLEKLLALDEAKWRREYVKYFLYK